MRETLQFRAKRIDNNEWVYGYYFKAPLTDENSGAKPEHGWFFLSDGEVRHCISTEHGVVFVIDPETLGMSINHTDKNGIPLYEGDIIRIDGITGTILYHWVFMSFMLSTRKRRYYLSDLVYVTIDNAIRDCKKIGEKYDKN